ncbi:MAG TPA: phosphoribosyltransferase family protein [Nitrospiria bacterium]|nr:phosphoribosyltransferase family protein [Nitrospiria bacterium]
MIFKNREEAAHQLAEKLSAYRGKNPLVLGIPRGAVLMARIIADALEGELDIVLVHKIGAPENPEFAIGSVTEIGTVYLNEAARDLPISPEYITERTRVETENLHEKRLRYTPNRDPSDPVDRIVIIVDDGMATGSTMISALRLMRLAKPARLIAAAAVAPPETLRQVEQEADETVCLETPEGFFAVGQFFAEFEQVTDEAVAAALREPEKKGR